MQASATDVTIKARLDRKQRPRRLYWTGTFYRNASLFRVLFSIINQNLQSRNWVITIYFNRFPISERDWLLFPDFAAKKELEYK